MSLRNSVKSWKRSKK